jgi:hypothetical protein
MFGKNKVHFSGDYPQCFDNNKEYEVWKLMMRISNSSPTAWVCSDCLPEYQHKMIGEGRCENSHVSFRIDGKGADRGIEGYVETRKK